MQMIMAVANGVTRPVGRSCVLTASARHVAAGKALEQIGCRVGPSLEPVMRARLKIKIGVRVGVRVRVRARVRVRVGVGVRAQVHVLLPRKRN